MFLRLQDLSFQIFVGAEKPQKINKQEQYCTCFFLELLRLYISNNSPSCFMVHNEGLVVGSDRLNYLNS